MFYSQLLLSKRGTLGIVWMAAHCHKRLKKHQIQQTDISSSVDKILDDEVCVVTHRILAFLLLGIVRIYSKKVEYLFNDCHEILNRLCSFKTGKSKQAGVGVSQSHYYSISLPKRFELDTFDLDLLENQDVAVGNVISHEQDNLADGLQKGGGTTCLLFKDSLRHLQENIPVSETQSKVYTPPRDVFGPHHMDQNLFMGTSSKSKISLAGVDVLRGTRFSLADCLDPSQLDEAEEEQMNKKPSDKDLKINFQELANDMDSDSDAGISNKRIHLSPSLDILHGTVTVLALEDRLEPMVLDEAEHEQLNCRSSNQNISSNLWDSSRPRPICEAEAGPMQYVGFDFVQNRSPKGSDRVESFGVLNESSISLVQFPNLKVSNEAEKEQGNDNPSHKEDILEEEHVKHPSTQLGFQEGDHHNFTAAVDNAKALDAGIKVVEVITPESRKCQRPEEFHASIVTSDSKLPGGGTPEVATVQTPGRKERAKIPKKRKTLLDSTTVVSNKVFKNWIDDPTDLKRKRRKVAHTLLDAWRACKHAHLPQSFFQLSISGISEDLGYLGCNKSFSQQIKKVGLSSDQDGARSPVTCEATYQIPAVRSPVREKLPLNVPSPIRERSPIAPGTPVGHPLRSHEPVEVADSDIIEPANSCESIEKGPLSSDSSGLDILFQEETSSFEGGDRLEKAAYSARTRTAGSYLGRKFLEKKRRREEEVLNLSLLLAGRTKKESARLFYEILVLKTREFIYVQQETAYRDILMRETPKLRGSLSE